MSSKTLSEVFLWAARG